MRTTEPERWQAALDKVASITPETLEKFYAQEFFELFSGQPLVRLGTREQKARFCTVEGLNQQLDDFIERRGIVYFIDEDVMSMVKHAFEKTREDHYGVQ